jgi:glucose/arabinose dehydrogenase
MMGMLALGMATAFGVPPAWGGATTLTTERVASGLARPVYVTHAPCDYDRVFIVEARSGSTGRIRILDISQSPPVLLATPFLSINNVATGNEQGLLGLAFHPDYLSNGYFYVNYTRASDGATVIARYTVSGSPSSSNLANAASAFTIMTIAQPFTNHNGGWLQFGPDGYLYIALGDGGNACDPSQNAQNLNSRLGKMLRIDVDGGSPFVSPLDNPFVGVAGLDEIWAYGLRNPWRCDFDELTGDLYIADVGQFEVEEINFQPASSVGGENYGWDCMEGTQCFRQQRLQPQRLHLLGCIADGPVS